MANVCSILEKMAYKLGIYASFWTKPLYEQNCLFVECSSECVCIKTFNIPSGKSSKLWVSYPPHWPKRCIDLFIKVLSESEYTYFPKCLNFPLIKCNLHIICFSMDCRFKNIAVFAGSISENEVCSLPLLGLHGNWIKCQTSSSPLYHCSYCTLSANHYILVNLSLDQVTTR